jgi:dTDP-4-amino-4,6-dideoxyglucose
VKRSVSDLAVFGGRPEFLNPILVGQPNNLDRRRFFDRMNWALDNQWLSNGGPLVQEFEERVADLAGVRNCVATCNATTALQLYARAARLTGEIVMPSMTFVATAHAMRWLGLEPVFCDVDPLTGCIGVSQVEAVLTERTAAILGVHLWGRACPVDELEKLAADRGVPLFFDAAHAIGCSSSGRAVGGFGAVEIFSFHATKVVSAFEGGAVVTDDDELAGQIRALHNFGIGPYGHEAGGTNAKLSEAGAAMGLTSLDAFDEAKRRNEENYELYRAELDGLPGVGLVAFDRRERNNYQYVILTIDESVTGIGRDLLQELLAAEKIGTKRYFSPACHELEPYRTENPVALPHTESIATSVLAVPTGTRTTAEDIRRVCGVIRLAVTEGRTVRDRWRRRESKESTASDTHREV